MATHAPPTTAEKLGLLPKVFFALAMAVKQLALYPLSSDAKSTGAFRWAVFGAMRSLLGSVTPAQERIIFPSTTTVFRTIAKEERFEPVIHKTASGLEICWFGPKNADRVFLFYHGGGYAIAASPGHIKWLSILQKDLSRSGRSVAVAVPAYTLTSIAAYPLQLRQGVEALNWALNDLGRKPSEIIIGGDSAGGNLSLGVISHFLHPHPDISTKIDLSEPLAGTVLVSPWCKFVGDPSFARNLNTDYIAEATGTRWKTQFLGSSQSDEYNCPILANADWYRGIDKVTAGIFVNGGSNEVLIDSIEATAKVLKSVHPRTEVVILPGAHEGMILDVGLGYKTKSKATQAIESWITNQWSS